MSGGSVAVITACTIAAVSGVYVANVAARVEAALDLRDLVPGAGGKEYALRLSLDEPTQTLCINLRTACAKGCAK